MIRGPSVVGPWWLREGIWKGDVDVREGIRVYACADQSIIRLWLFR